MRLSPQVRFYMGEFSVTGGEIARTVGGAGAVKCIKRVIEVEPIAGLGRRKGTGSRLTAAQRIDALPPPGT